MTTHSAAAMWHAAQPANPASIVGTYLRSRGIAPSGGLPATLRALASPPAMIAVFGMAHEAEPGELSISDASIRAVHRTLLRPDGSGKAAVEKPKTMWGHVSGSPITLAPINDLVGLAITEGIEDGLALHVATGLGAWAAGAAGFLPKLAPAVPRHANCITIGGDFDRDGQRKARELADALIAGGFTVAIREAEHNGQ
jgi:Toprim domain